MNNRIDSCDYFIRRKYYIPRQGILRRMRQRDMFFKSAADVLGDGFVFVDPENPLRHTVLLQHKVKIELAWDVDLVPRERSIFQYYHKYVNEAEMTRVLCAYAKILPMFGLSRKERTQLLIALAMWLSFESYPAVFSQYMLVMHDAMHNIDSVDVDVLEAHAMVTFLLSVESGVVNASPVSNLSKIIYCAQVYGLNFLQLEHK